MIGDAWATHVLAVILALPAARAEKGASKRQQYCTTMLATRNTIYNIRARYNILMRYTRYTLPLNLRKTYQTLRRLRSKPWSQVPTLLPRGPCKTAPISEYVLMMTYMLQFDYGAINSLVRDRHASGDAETPNNTNPLPWHRIVLIHTVVSPSITATNTPY